MKQLKDGVQNNLPKKVYESFTKATLLPGNGMEQVGC